MKKRCPTCGDGSGTLSVAGNDGIDCWDERCPSNMAKKRINSRQKGKRGELLVCKLLTKTAGGEWRRTAQVRGKNHGAPDIESPASPNLWVEVKDRAGWYVGCTPWMQAWATCRKEAEEAGKVPVLIWRCARGRFAATVGVVQIHGLQAVTYGDIGWAVVYAEQLAKGVVIP